MKKIARFAVRYVSAALSCVYLFTVGFAFPRNRQLLLKICEHFGLDREASASSGPPTIAAAREMISEVTLCDLIPGEAPFQMLRQPLAAYGTPSALELMVINHLIRQYSPVNLFEIGTFDGRTTLNMACNSPPGAKVYTLDLPTELQDFPIIVPEGTSEAQKAILGSKYLGTDCETKIVQLYGDSTTFDFSPFFNKMDFAFVDGAHDYRTVLSDSRTALKLLRDGAGVILWHNSDFEGVARALNECYSEIEGFEGLKHIEGTTMTSLVVNGRAAKTMNHKVDGNEIVRYESRYGTA